MQNIQLFIVITSFVNIKDANINTVSNTLQVIISQVTLLSLQIRSIAATANDIADIANMNLTNLIALFILCYYYHLYDCVHCKQHENLEKINEKPEHYVAKTSIITEESVKPSTIK